jgi:predicted lipid-binding transport protein (Tim44 family)
MARISTLGVIALLTTTLLALGCSSEERSPDGASESPPASAQQPGSDRGEAGGQSPSAQQPGAQSQPQQPAPQGQAAGPEFSDGQIEAAGRIYAEVQEVQQELQSGDQSKQQAAKQMQQRMQEAVSEEDALSGQQFQQIMQQIRQDPELRKSFFQALEEAGGQVPQAQGPGGS